MHATRRKKAPAVAPVTRAIRAALATMLALSAPGVVLAANNAPVIPAKAGSQAHVTPVDLTRVIPDAQADAATFAVDTIEIDNVDNIDAHTPNDATGLSGYGTYSAHVTNHADITATADGPGDATAYAAISSAGYETYLGNVADATIVANAMTTDGNALAVGAYASAQGIATLANNGISTAHAISETGDAQAYAAVVYGGAAGIGLLINGGDLAADASAGAGAEANAIAALAYGTVASIFNDANATANAQAGEGGDASARAARVLGMYTAIDNQGALSAFAKADGGSAEAIALDGFGYLGNSAYNDGDITAAATAIGGDANAVGVRSIGYSFNAYVSNTGTIAAHAIGEEAHANGIINATYYLGDADVINAGDVQAVAEGTLKALAVGVYDLSVIYDATIVNTGGIVASAVVEGGDGTAVQVAQAIGAQAMRMYGFDYGSVALDNDGSLAAMASVEYGYAAAWGTVVLSAQPFGAASMDNDGTIASYAHADAGFAASTGAYIASNVGDTTVVNHGDIVGSGYVGDGYAYVTGLDVKSTAAPGYGSIATIDNQATIEGHAVGYGAIVYGTGARAVGDTVEIDNAAGAYILATATTELFGGAFATAVEASGVHGIDIVNDGRIVAIGAAHADTIYYGASRAVGIVAEASIYGDISVVNNGDIIATATADDVVTFFGGGAGATGIDTYAKYDAVVDNAGDITASAITQYGIAGATGAVVHGKYYGHMVNSGDIVAYAYAGSLATDSYAGTTAASGVRLFYAEVGVTENTGSIVATAISHAEDGHYARDTVAFAYGTLTDAWRSVGIVNSGDIEANAQADFGDARAYGSMVRGGYAATTDNAGTMIARAQAEGGAALAVGSYTFAQIFEYLGCDETGCHYAPVAGDASLSNSGDIMAIASAEGGIADAYGAIVIALDNATVDNSGTIVARAEGDDANAMGVLMSSEGGTNTLRNTGTIAAFGDGDRFAVWSSNDAIATIDNAGRLIGAVRTGERDDTFDNAGIWHAVGASDFGAGDDRVTNAGTLLLENATVNLGAATNANAFANTGTMVVSGTSTLDMGGAFAARNDGMLSFVDGAADDALTLVGDLAGEGRMAFDVDAGSGASDLLTVDGTIDASTMQTIDVHLVDLPGAAHAAIPLVAIAGDASLDQFTLGHVDYATDGFLAMSFGLGARIDAANASPDMVMLELGVDGLNAMGALAASIAPAAMSLVDATVGTWRQRVGIVPDAPSDTGLSPWVRGFADSGDAAPDYEGFAPVGGGGFHQSNQGWEFGLEARPLDHVAVGALVSTADGTQRLDASPGEDRLDATTFGLYATWLPIGGGTYVDASMRWTGFDVRLQAPTGTHETNASAQTFNLEGGYVFTLGSGLRVIPQLQYTYTHIADIGPLQGDQSTFEARGGDASRARLGVGVERSFESAGVTWTPYGSVNAVHAFDGRFAYSVGDAFGGAATLDGTGAMVEGGVGASVGKFTVTGGVQWADGGTSDGAFGGQLVLRYRW